MKNRKPQGAFYERAPNILTEKIAELSSLLTNYRNKGHSADVLKFYEEVLDAMKLAHLYMQQSIRVEKHIILFLSEKKKWFPIRLHLISHARPESTGFVKSRYDCINTIAFTTAYQITPMS